VLTVSHGKKISGRIGRKVQAVDTCAICLTACGSKLEREARGSGIPTCLHYLSLSESFSLCVMNVGLFFLLNAQLDEATAWKDLQLDL
jgi:hypothetical protein